MNKKIWIIVDHPMQITTAVGLALYFGKDYTVNLLISKHPYWCGADVASFSSYFKEIHWFFKAGFSWIFPREIGKILYNKQKIKKLEINKNDIFLVLSNKVFLETLLFSIYNENKRVSINPDYLIDGVLLPYQGGEYREKIISKIWNCTLLLFFKMEPIIYCKHTKDRALYALFYKKGNGAVFSRCFSIKNVGVNNLSPDEIHDVSIYVRDMICQIREENKRKMVVFFGNSNYPNKYHIDFTNRCLRYIEEFFPEYDYIFKSHPNDHGEAEAVELRQFKIYQQKIIAELFYLENLDKIYRCFSIASTAVRHSIDIGIPSYYFLKLYKDYSPDLNDLLMSMAADTNSKAFIESFEEPPIAYEVDYNLEEVERGLKKINDFLYEN